MRILITGANRGLGYFLTKLGLEKGHIIVAGVRSLEVSAIRLLVPLQEMYKEKLEIVQLDVTNEQSVLFAAESAKEKGKQIDSIINNAGVLLERDKSIEELDIEECMKTIDINTLGPMRVIKHFLPLLEQGEKQSIINITSEAGSLTNAYSGDYPYGISKVALNMFSEKLNVYLRGKDIHVFAVHPGWMRTDMGGEQAPTDPTDTAEGIYDMIERNVTINGQYVFVDFKGQPMKI
ncbi:SDR family oxidoreductase [Lederbergia lenta]|uniref:SDR family oxidoreductase n=1 Tax=Lederbergia lenta TaxID=1467 RepID=UPI00203FFEB7|nr:SDR family oxidoreductase [Lederbergia lenta]MCM3110986.1 SDR family oxidoreductase [Lederbergia lenta]